MSICLFIINKTTCEKIGKTKQNEILCPHIFNHTNLAEVTLAYHIPIICLQDQLILVFTNAWLLQFICHDRLCAGRKEKKGPKMQDTQRWDWNSKHSFYCWKNLLIK